MAKRESWEGAYFSNRKSAHKAFEACGEGGSATEDYRLDFGASFLLKSQP
jgi:hypothetical protein